MRKPSRKQETQGETRKQETQGSTSTWSPGDPVDKKTDYSVI